MTEPVWMHALVWIGLPLLGAGAGWLLKAITGWVVVPPVGALQGLFKLVDELVASVGEPRATIGAVAVGAVAGLVLALIAEQDRLTVTVSHDQVSLARGESSRRIERASVGAVFLDGKQLVVLGRGTEELAREASDLDADRLRTPSSPTGIPGWRAEIHTRTNTGSGSRTRPISHRAPTRCSRPERGRWAREATARRRGRAARRARQARRRGPGGKKAPVLAPRRRVRDPLPTALTSQDDAR